MATEPLISVIIPCYNAQRFLAEAINSVLQQTLANYEVICIDDGSQDKTAEIIRSFGAQVRAEFGPNRGASSARNRGTQLARGEFIQYLDADDLLRPDALHKRVNALVTTGADVAYSDWQRVEEQEDGSFLPGEIISRRLEEIHPTPEIALFTQFWAPPAALLYRRRIVHAIGGWNESLPIIQDARFLLDAALWGGKFIYVPSVGAEYRVHGESSLSRKNPLQFVKDCFQNACQVEAYWRRHGGLTAERRAALAQVYHYTARTLFVAEKALFQENLRKLYAIEPGFRCNFPKVAGLCLALFGQKGANFLLAMSGKMPQVSQ